MKHGKHEEEERAGAERHQVARELAKFMRQLDLPRATMSKVFEREVQSDDNGKSARRFSVACSKPGFIWLNKLERSKQQRSRPARPIQKPFCAELAATDESYWAVVNEIIRVMPAAEKERVGHHWKELLGFAHCLRDPSFVQAIVADGPHETQAQDVGKSRTFRNEYTLLFSQRFPVLPQSVRIPHLVEDVHSVLDHDQVHGKRSQH
jgi:hypothetical protein